MNAPRDPVAARILDLESKDDADIELRAVGYEALAATIDEDFEVANETIGQLTASEVVAITSCDWVFEVRETLLGWVLGATRGTPDVADLALASTIRGHRLAVLRGALP